jgi:hypothetical protein
LNQQLRHPQISRVGFNLDLTTNKPLLGLIRLDWGLSQKSRKMTLPPDKQSVTLFSAPIAPLGTKEANLD